MADGRLQVIRSLGEKSMCVKNLIFQEYGSPHELLQIDGGAFRKMVDETGRQTAKVLEKVAEKAFNKIKDE